MFTVNELIRELQKYGPDCPVEICDDDTRGTIDIMRVGFEHLSRTVIIVTDQ